MAHCHLTPLRRSGAHMAWGLLACTLLLLTPQISQAFKRSQSGEGKTLYWSSYPIPFDVNAAGSPGLDVTATLSAIRESFQTWTQPDCTCLRFQDKGNTDATTLGYDQENPEKNTNLILFQTQSWSHSPQAVAVTSTVFKKTDGQIVAFDMELNQVNFSFSLTGQSDRMDVQNTVTHEVGHVIGLDHSDQKSAAMFAAGQPGETQKRALHTDDTEGLCELYPKTDNGTCAVINPNPSTQGCDCRSTHSIRHFPSSLLFLTLTFFFLLYRRHSKDETKNNPGMIHGRAGTRPAPTHDSKDETKNNPRT